MAFYSEYNVFHSAIIIGIITLIVYIYMRSRKSLIVKHIRQRYDYIIVGAGSAGAVLAARLSEDPDITVLLIEAGDEDKNKLTNSIPLASGTLLQTDEDWQYFTEPQKHSTFASFYGGVNQSFWPRGKVLGGCSVINLMQYVRGSRHDYDEWKRSGCEGWGYEDVLPYFLKSEDVLVDELAKSKYHNKGGPLGVSLETCPISKMFIQAGKELGFEEVDYNGENQIGFGVSQVNVRNGKRVSTANAFLRPAMARNNLHVAVKTHATKIVLEGKSAKGVSFYRNGKPQTVISNKDVILSAGVVGSAQLLLLSGIGPKDHLKYLDIPLVEDLPVGQNLQDHLLLHMPSDINTKESITESKATSIKTLVEYFVYKTGPLASTGIVGSAFVRSPDCDEQFPDIQFHIACAQPRMKDIKCDKTKVKGLFTEVSHEGFSLIAILLHPKSRGSITLKSRNPFDHPVIDPNYLSEQEDIDTFMKAIKLSEKLYETKAFKNKGATMDRLKLWEQNGQKKHEVGTDAFYESLIRTAASSVYHPTSTCKMGPIEASTTVVDPQLRVKGIKGLRVVDASVMPNITSGNTCAPVIMIAEKAVDMILGKDTVQAIRNKLN